MNVEKSESARGFRLLAAGAAIGLLFAAWGLLERSPRQTPIEADAVARVNDVVIDTARYQRAIDNHAAVYGEPPDAESRARLLMQLVEEELLVQRGIELGMPASETTVRAAIVQSMIASVTAEADAADPDEAELRSYLEEHAGRYTYASALDVDAWIADDEWLAQDFLTRLRRDGFAEDDGVRAVAGLPDGPLPIERLRMFVGPSIAAAANDMPDGASAVFARQGRWYVIRVAARSESVLPELDAVRSQVLIDYRRDLADARLRDYLDGLLRQRDVSIAITP